MFADVLRQNIENSLKNDIISTEQDQKNLDLLNILFNKLKEEIIDIHAMKKELSLNRYNDIFITSSKKVFSNNFYNENIISSSFQTKNEDLIAFLSKNKFKKTVSDFKAWLDEKEISIIVFFDHDGGGMESWNNYYLRLNKS